MAESLTVAVLGAGVVGRTLAAALGRAGYPIVLGSRDPQSDRLAAAAAEVSAEATSTVTATTHAAAVRAADVTIVTTPGDQAASLAMDLGEALNGRVVIDATNFVGPSAPKLNAVAEFAANGAVVYRSFNSVGWEQMQQPVFGDVRSDMPFYGPEGDERPKVGQVIADVGFRPLYLGGTPQALDAVDALARVWFLLVFSQGWDRRLGLHFLTSADDH